MKLFQIALLLFVCLGNSRTVLARYYDLYRADYPKGAFCSAIAGACASDNDPESGFFQNPASIDAPYIESDLQFDGDYSPSDNLEPGMKTSSDFNQNLFMGGVGYNGEKWGWAISIFGYYNTLKTQASFVDDSDKSRSITATDTSFNVNLNIPFAWRLKPYLSLGGALSTLFYYEKLQVEGSPKAGTKPIDKLPPLGLTLGYLWVPNNRFRFGSFGRTAQTYIVNQDLTVQQFTTQLQLSEQLGLHMPWMVANGVSWLPWEDERTLLFDLDIIGTTTNGYERTLDTFANAASDKNFRPKGRDLVLEPHLGWRSPFFFVRHLYYFAGSYYENSRWEGLSGRIHGTAGISYKVKFPFIQNLIGDFEAIIMADVAKNYFDFQFSFR